MRFLRSRLLKVVVFIAVAVGTALFVNHLNNAGYEKATQEMNEATLPLVFCSVDGTVVNRLVGYTQTMNTGLMRESVVPINKDYGVDLLLSDESDYADSCSYELRNIAGDSLIERGDLDMVEQKDLYDVYQVRFRMDLEANTEYVLVFILHHGKQDVRYYTRVVKLEEAYVPDMTSYAVEFHNACFEKKVDPEKGNLAYNTLEAPIGGTSDTLAHVDLHSNYDTVSFGGLALSPVTPIVPTVQELESDYAVIKIAYIVEYLKDGISHFYRVEEFYTENFNKSSRTVELLAFDRYIDSFFDENYMSAERNAACLGICKDPAIERVSAGNDRKLAFAKEGELWYYDYAEDSLSMVFSFARGSFKDVRTVNPNVGINIVDMDDDGNIYFVCYGYQCRGIHEGKNGLVLYYYKPADSSLTEVFFVETDEPYEVMKQEVGRFTFYDGEKDFFCLLDGTIYAVDLKKLELETQMTGIPSERYLVSRNRKIIAYPNAEKEEDTTELTIRNFETGDTFTRTGSGNDRLMELGFVNNDLIYGVADAADIVIASDGEAILPLHDIYIVGPDGSELKHYSKPGVYVMDSRLEIDTIYLERAVKKNQFFSETDPDYISYKAADERTNATIKESSDPYAYAQLDIVFPSDMYVGQTGQYKMTREQAKIDSKEFSVASSVRQGGNYLYNQFGYVGAYGSAGQAIKAVGASGTGFVINGTGKTIYRGTVAKDYNTVADNIRETPCADRDKTLLACAYMCLTYEHYDVTLEEVLACGSYEEAWEKFSYGAGINISGIDLDTALYFLDRDVPFAAKIGDGRYVLVISYNSTHIRYYDPMSGEEVKVTREEFEDALSVHSNTMYTYTSQ